MDFILDQIVAASNAKVHLGAVTLALSVPDVACAAEFGSTNATRYVEWVDRWLSPPGSSYRDHGLDGGTMYALRCHLLHEGKTVPAEVLRPKGSASEKRLIAFHVGPHVEHLTSAIVRGDDGSVESWTTLDSRTFPDEMIVAARNWLSHADSSAETQSRLRKVVAIRENPIGVVRVAINGENASRAFCTEI